jgi:hypothetical protein
MEKVTSKTSGKVFYFPTIEEIQEADADCVGFCLACGAEADGVEPDANKYECECCGEPRVYGAAEFALRGWVAS